MKKKSLIIVSTLVTIIIMMLFIGTGLVKRTDVYLADYSLSKDGLTLTMDIGISSSMGYTRGYTVKQRGDSRYITFYSTFGGLNSHIGAKNNFEIELNPTCTKIYFYHGDEGYTLVLQKNESINKWVKNEPHSKL